MHQRSDHQLGFSMLAFLFWVVLAAFVMTVLVKLGPVYVTNWTIRSVMEEVSHLPEALEGGKKGVRDQLWRRLEINDVTTVEPSAFSIVDEPGGNLMIVLDYEVRVHMFFNVDAVVSFDDEVLVTGR